MPADSDPHPDYPDLSGRTIIVAGAGGGGIGTCVSGMLASVGATVIGVDNRAEALGDFTAATSADGRTHPTVVADLLVALSSVAGLTSMPFGAPYAAAKSALMSLVRTAALEWGPLGIRVNAVAPGTVRTPKSLRGNNNPPPDTRARLTGQGA